MDHYLYDTFRYSFGTILGRQPRSGNKHHVPFYRNLPCFSKRSKTGWRGPKKS